LLTANVAHESLFSWADSAIESRHGSLSVEAFDLKLAKLDVEVCYKVFENISTLCHQFRCLLVSEDFLDVFFGALKVWEKKNEHFLWIARDFYEVDYIVYLVEVTVQDLSTHFNAIFVVTDIHGRRPFLGNDVDLVASNVTITIFCVNS